MSTLTTSTEATTTIEISIEITKEITINITAKTTLNATRTMMTTTETTVAATATTAATIIALIITASTTITTTTPNNNQILDKIFIIGDSIIKHIEPHKLKRSFRNDDKKFFVWSNPGTLIEDMYDNCRPATRRNASRITLYKVNTLLGNKCESRNLGFINNENINNASHLNGSKLHLSSHGTSILSSNFILAIKD